MDRAYQIIAGGVAARFHESRAKVRVYGGGFANGKTTGAVAETLRIAMDYPGAAILLARATYPKLNSTLRREFAKWCPPKWIKSFDKTKDNTCTLHNGTIIDFRYIQIKTDEEGEGTSNLLSANYDFIVVDQIDDPEITYEDFLQLLGRLRGSAPYAGDDMSMPRTGPRQIVLTLNPTLGWPYKRLVKPLHDWRRGVRNDDLLCERDSEGNVVLKDGKPIPIIEVFEASTYDNAQNLEPDYIKTLEATYSGKMRDRYLLGKWVAFDGVVYDEWDETLHTVAHEHLVQHVEQLRMEGYALTLAEGYDFGQTAPSAYLLSLTDADGITYVIDGFYEPHLSIEDQAARIKALREEYAPDVLATQPYVAAWADPAIFRGNMSSRKVVGASVARMFQDEGVMMLRGNNAIMNGIVKVKALLKPQMKLLHPFTHAWGSPKLIVSDRLAWFAEEINTYRWKRNASDNMKDEPVDSKNHAMDALRYMLSLTPTPARLSAPWRRRNTRFPVPKTWVEQEAPARDSRAHRHL